MAAYTAAGAAARAATATLASLDKVTAMYTSTRQYYMLDDLAETSTQAKRVRCGIIISTTHRPGAYGSVTSGDFAGPVVPAGKQSACKA